VIAGGRRPVTLKSLQFRREREASWLELERLLALVAASGRGALTPVDIERFPLLYRSALSSLSVARAIALDRALIAYLDDLALRAFLTLYAPPLDLWAAVRRFFIATFPRSVRALRVHLAIAAAVFALGVLSGYVLVHGNEGWFASLVPAELAGGRGPASSVAELKAVLTEPVPHAVLDFVANVLFSHNTLIALLTFGLGMLAGVPALLLTLYQGLVLGAFMEIHVRRGLGVDFAAWVGVNGVTEMLAFLLFAAAGLRLGEILVFPERLSRLDAYAVHGRTAAKVATGAGVMLIVAAVLEGYVREALQSDASRIGVAVLTAAVWGLYFVRAGRGIER